MRIFSTILTLFIACQFALAQQPLLYTRPSQLAKVFQRVGTTDMEIIYHSPLANGRNVFGDVVIYNDTMHGKPHPWRAGANENTVIKFSHDVMVNGKPLKAGSYGLHIYVSERSWEVTFSKDYQAWGSFTYTDSNDALRVSVTPHDTDYQEWLSYRFLNPRAHATNIELHWADKLIEFEVSTNVDANIIADVEKMEEKPWNALLVAANSYLELGPDNMDKAMELVNASIEMNAAMSNRIFKVQLLEKQGKTKEAEALKKEAIEKASPVDLFSYAMSLNNKGETEASLEILALNEKKNPDHWYAYLGYANFYRTKEDKRAIAYHEKALEFAPENAKGFAKYQLGYAKRKLGQ